MYRSAEIIATQSSDSCMLKNTLTPVAASWESKLYDPQLFHYPYADMQKRDSRSRLNFR